jgi:hypothetical protein
MLCCAVLGAPWQVHGPFQMLNIINFLVFRITRTVLYSLETVLAPTPAQIVSCFARGLGAEREGGGGLITRTVLYCLE